MFGIDFDRIREDFPILGEVCPPRPLIYLDNAATTQKPRQVIETVANYYRRQNANVHRALYRLGEEATAAYESSRARVAQFIKAGSVREIVFVRGATEAINLVAGSWGRKVLKPGDTVLVSEMEHHSNLVPWQMVARERGAGLKFIPFLPDGTLDLSHLEDMLDGVALLAVTQMSNVFGTINPVAEIVARAHARGVPVLVDAAQSVPHIPVDVKQIDCDFLAFSGHKMCGPTGIGVLYAKEKWLEMMDPYQCGGEMVSAVWSDRAQWNDLPYKFEAGTPNIAGAIGLGAAIDYLGALGMDNIARYEEHLARYALAAMRQIEGVRIFGEAPARGAVISFSLQDIHPHDIAQFLDADEIAIRAGHHCAQPVMRKLGVPATARASCYFYNSTDEIDQLVSSLKKVKEFFSLKSSRGNC